MYHATKNYHELGGARFVFGGELLVKAGAKLKFEDGAEAEGLPDAILPEVKYMAEIGSDVTTVAALRASVNQLIANLKASGLMASAAPTIAVATQPTGLELVAGAIDSGDVLTAAFTVSDGSAPTYQWYSNATNSNAGGSAISGATAASYAVPTGTTAGTYHYYCVASHDGVTHASAAATVTVAAA
jgi:hypothetical protein